MSIGQLPGIVSILFPVIIGVQLDRKYIIWENGADYQSGDDIKNGEQNEAAKNGP